MEETIKLLKVEYLSNHCMDKGEIIGNLECGSAQPSLLMVFLLLTHYMSETESESWHSVGHNVYIILPLNMYAVNVALRS